LNALLAEDPESPRRPVLITAIGGTAGIGKTALAVHAGRRGTARRSMRR
jgi:hypothetical protein